MGGSGNHVEVDLTYRRYPRQDTHNDAVVFLRGVENLDRLIPHLPLRDSR